MIKQLFKPLVLISILILTSCGAPKAVPEEGQSENLIIYYAPESGTGELLKAAKRYGSKVIYVYRNINGIAVTVPKGKTVPEAMKYYGKVDGVLSVVKDERMQLD